MFGSRARNESNNGSDIDVLVLCDAPVLPNTVVDSLLEQYGENIDIAHYSYGGMQILVEQGALFAWHLREEGVPLHRRADRLEAMLAVMEPYAGHLRDLEVLLVVFEEAMASLGDRCAFQFDLGVVATVVRNAGIIMHNLLGSRDFSPSAPIRLESVPGAPMLPIDEDLYDFLSACRRASERGAQIENSDVSADHLITQVEGIRPWLYSCITCAKASGQ